MTDFKMLALDVLFPARCPVCGDVIPFMNRTPLHVKFDPYYIRDSAGSRPAKMRRRPMPPYDALICDECMEQFDFIHEPYCRRCGKQLYEKTIAKEAETPAAGSAASSKPKAVEFVTFSDGLCHDCRTKTRLFKQCRSLMMYDDVSSHVLINLKYNHKKENVALLGLLAADRLGAWVGSMGIDFITAVPIHKKRLRKRGYNQALEIAKEMGLYLGIPVVDGVILRSKNTKALKELGPDDRLMELQEAFTIGRRLKNGPTVLLIDDIYTTGSTMEACTETLIRAGAGCVYGLCIAAGRDIIETRIAQSRS